jgi:RNA polymerase sigma factor (sigma-70 family)
MDTRSEPLSEAERRAEAERIDARNQVVVKNLGLIVPIMKCIHGIARQDRDDAFQVGVLALMKAWALYDPSRGAFSTYACTAIRHDLLNWLKTTTTTVHVPYNEVAPHLRERAAKARQACAPLTFDPPGPECACAADDADEEEARAQLVRGWLPLLSARDREVIRCRYAYGMSLREAADVLDVGRERIRQLADRAVGALRKMAEAAS